MYCGRAISEQNSDIHEAGNSACSGTVLFRLYFGEEGPRQVFMIRNKASFYSAELSTPPQPPAWGTTPCRLSATAYSIYSQLPSILEVVPPSAT